ncbi:U11/U12 small nuclear ribonucleoprotein 65 kDa protein [Phtheirospermum japonicum]|uniref:U11/U12 small nuclear ribonucleoprotein 65 kDa protein n=1 Tax=Phtheirospermum japonicum TaxID=374723 RepID=A0A830CAM3_9LAMI|nr:U11/U12 small nuclear ribonucleoprotein 65 kDa protein [Phtheirospermum japonicum]
MAEPEATQQHLGHHRRAVAEEESTSSSSVTLLVRHLPEAIPPETINRLFSPYGASSVRPSFHGRVRNCVFVDFKNELSASQAQKQLHGLQFLGKVLSVERASKVIDALKIKQEGETQTRKVNDPSVPGDNSRGLYTHASEPIAGKLGVDYPFPPHLEYAYPPPDGHILTNVVNALIAVPRFYTQVLHLMNKMNIPAPFRSALPTPPLPASVPVPPPPPSAQTKMKDLSSSESEMESSDEEVRPEARPKRKRVKRQAIVGPGVDNDVAHEAVGLKEVTLVPKEKPIIKKKNPVLQIRIAPKQIQPEVKDDGAAKESQEQNTCDHGPYATLEEIQNGKLPPEEILSLPRFKNYTTGDPTPVLYVKNLAKDVAVDDFYFIFGSFFGSIDAAKSSLSVKLMQEGRMRGQAFLTFPTLELARNALDFCKSGKILEASRIFRDMQMEGELPKANVVAHNLMLDVFSQGGDVGRSRDSGSV